MKKTLGGDRLGSGNRMKVDLHGYERSTHDLGYLWRSTMSAGTLVPFLKEVALPGDTFDIDLGCDVKTHPTLGPLFGSFKLQLDVFLCPVRLYQGQLHNNKLGIGLKMSNVKLPTYELIAKQISFETPPNDLDNSQVNPSSIFAYLGVRGVGLNNNLEDAVRTFNGIPWLGYWDIYKNYYSNKQEEIGAVIHTGIPTVQMRTDTVSLDGNLLAFGSGGTIRTASSNSVFQLNEINPANPQNLADVIVWLDSSIPVTFQDLGNVIVFAPGVYQCIYDFTRWGERQVSFWTYRSADEQPIQPITVATFDLDQIDTMRERILAHSVNNTPFNINAQNLEPFSLALQGGDNFHSKEYSQEGLGLKTYQSDIFNNWLSTEWLDGAGGINEISSVDTTGNTFTIDQLNLAKKVYDMLNRIAVSGGTFDDWIDAVYTHDRYTKAESPMYMGGLIKEVVFQEVISNAEAQPAEGSGSQPLGTLAGRGVLAQKHKGGSMTIRVDEPSYIIGIVSITPRIDYSQGNDWDTHLVTVDDFHKPALDEIGFQELITERMAWWSTYFNGGSWLTLSAGKQPAWIEYMTNHNRLRGNFAIPNNEQFMVLDRKYLPEEDGDHYVIKDLTTYIDPSKYNNIFAQTSLDSQNFWVQIACDITARRKMSAKVMPNL